MIHGHHHQSTADRSQNDGDAAAKLQFPDWSFLDRKGRVASLPSADAAERSEQLASVVWFIYGPEWPERFMLYQSFHRGKRDRVVGVLKSDRGCAPACMAKLLRMLHSPIRVAVRSGPMERTPLLSVSPSPHASGCCFVLPGRVL